MLQRLLLDERQLLLLMALQCRLQTPHTVVVVIVVVVVVVGVVVLSSCCSVVVVAGVAVVVGVVVFVGVVVVVIQWYSQKCSTTLYDKYRFCILQRDDPQSYNSV